MVARSVGLFDKRINSLRIYARSTARLHPSHLDSIDWPNCYVCYRYAFDRVMLPARLTVLPNPTHFSHFRRFDQFELNLRTAEIHKQGKRVKLQDQPCQVLALLTERPGELVTREELQKKLWPNDTFVDFDHGVNIAINKLRDALGDSVEHPRFIETLPRRGYRWLSPVEHAGDISANVQVAVSVSPPREVQSSPGGATAAVPASKVRL